MASLSTIEAPMLPGTGIPVAVRQTSPTLPDEIVVVGQALQPTPVFDTYWRFAAARHAVYEARVAGKPGPWTDDPILMRHRFTNAFRAADRVSQFLIREVAYNGSQDPSELAFRVLLFKFFNKVETWEALKCNFGTPTLSSFDISTWSEFLTERHSRGVRLYSAAYVIPPPQFGGTRKHTNHLRLLAFMMEDGLVESLMGAGSMREAFNLLRAFPSLGDFLAFQFLIDLNYTQLLRFDEMDFVVAGPGAKDGIRKCFGPQSAGMETELIRYMADSQEEHFDRLGLRFRGLRGRRLQLIDCQNLFCEVDKYARVAHPDISGLSGRKRIKQVFSPDARPVRAWFPPKWGINSD
jgi:hypothetical protein